MFETVNRDEINAPCDAKREWVAPHVRRMMAGSAEDAITGASDGGQPS